MSEQNGAMVSAEGQRAFMEIVHNMLMGSRYDLMQHIVGDRRKDIYDSAHLPKVLTVDDYWNLHIREAHAARYNELMAKETWDVAFEVFEVPDEDRTTPFEEAWANLPKQLYIEDSWCADERGSLIWQKIRQADIEAGVGEYGIIVIGINDNKDLSEPAELYTGTRNPSKLTELLFLQSFPQKYAKIAAVEKDRTSRRQGWPTMYTITTPDLAQYGQTKTGNVHWTRVVHLSDSGGVISQPRTEPVFNNLLGIQKVLCSSPEMYFRGAFPGIGFKTPESLAGKVKINEEALKNTMEKYMQDFQRWFAVSNLDMQQLSPQVVDPKPYVDAQIEAMCVKVPVAKRIYMGSERGELASNQDERRWGGIRRIHQDYHNKPLVLNRLINRFLLLGVLPKPKEFFSYFPDATTMTDREKAELAKLRTELMGTYIEKKVELLYTPLDWMVKELHMEEAEAMTILENAAKAVEEKQAEEEEQLLMAEEVDEDADADAELDDDEEEADEE